MADKAGVPVILQPGVAVVHSLTDAGSAAIAEGNAVVRAGLWFSNPRNWVRITYVVGGVFIALTGLAMLASESSTLRGAAASTARAAFKVGAVAA